MNCKTAISLLALILVFPWCQAVELPPYSAFAPEVTAPRNYSLLTLEEPMRETVPDTYAPGLYHPFASCNRFQDAFIDAFRTGKARHSILGYTSPDSLLKAELNIIAGYEHSFQDSAYGFLYKGLRLKSTIGSHVQLNSLWWNGVFDGDKQQAEGSELVDGCLFERKASLRLDNMQGDISYHARDLSLSIGRGNFPIGNSISGSIILNNRVNDYGYLLAEGKAGDFSLSFLHGTLSADSLDASSAYPNKVLPDKYFVLHQLAYHPGSNLSLALGETVIYGNRSMDINYLLPNTFWRATEHNLGDRDNVLIYATARFRPHPNLLTYGQVALDELSYSKLFSNWWGNKYALQGGFKYMLPNLWGNSQSPSIGMELTAVRPFTYTHYMNHTQYSHDGRSLGYPKGSNIVDASMLISVPWRFELTWQSELSFGKYGSFGHDYLTNYNVIFPGELSQSATATWFQGQASTYTELKQSLLCDIFAHHRLLINFQARHQDKWDSSLGAAWQFSY